MTTLHIHISQLIEDAQSGVTNIDIAYQQVVMSLFTRGLFSQSVAVAITEHFKPVTDAVKVAKSKFISTSEGEHLCAMIEAASHAVMDIRVVYNNLLMSLIQTPLASNMANIDDAFKDFVSALDAASAKFCIEQ